MAKKTTKSKKSKKGADEPVARKKSKGGGSVVVDFSKAKAGGRLRVPEGDYLFKIGEVKQDTSKSGNSMLVITFTGVEGKVKGKSVKDYFVLNDNNLWKLRQLMEAAGMDVPAKKSRINLGEFKGQQVGITLVDDEYTNDEGRTSTSSKPADYIAPDDLSDQDDDDDDDDDDDQEDDEDDLDDAEDDDEDDDDDDDDEDDLDEEDDI